MNKEPFNISLLDIDKVIKDEGLKEVTSEFIKESSTNRFHPEGLFSEQIFGEIASQMRMQTCGYIKLNCRVFHPIIYQNLHSLKRFYTEIMAGTSYAVWDPDQGDFVRASETEQGANTGFTFFLKYFDKIDFQKNTSLKRSDKIDVINKFKNLRLIDKIIVIPAGVRDMKEDQGRMEKDSVNSIYASLLRNAKSMTRGADTNPLFDSVHYTIQKRVLEIYEKVAEIVRGKKGFFEGRYSHRNIARGTRNVVTATDLDAASPDSPQYHKVDETKVPLFQAAKAGADSIIYWYKTLFYDQVLNMSSENVPLIDPKTLRLEYVPLDIKDKDLMLTAEGIEKTIDRFRDPFNRFKPVTARSGDKTYYTFMVYDRGDRVHIVRNVDEFKLELQQAEMTFEPDKLRPITHAEMLYICAFFAYKGTHATVTRYPISDEQSIYISKTHLVTTAPARVVRLMQRATDDDTDQILPEYPIEGNQFVDALMLHPTRLKSLTADFDGNCLVGETKVEVRYTNAWFKTCCYKIKNEKHTTDQDLKRVMNAIDARVYRVLDGHNYAEIEMDLMPQIGTHVLDKNGARVWDVPDGIEVLSYKDNSPIYLPVTKVTVEDDCEVAEIRVGGKTAIVSTNPSLAAFDHRTAELEKIAPSAAKERYAPFIKGHTTFVDDDTTYHTGYTLGSSSMTIDTICPHVVKGMSVRAAFGYLSAIIDKFCKFELNTTMLGPSIMVRNATNETQRLLESLLYALTIRYTSIVTGDILTVYMNDEDLFAYAKYIRFQSTANKKMLFKWISSQHEYIQDLIPLTVHERDKISSSEATSYANKLRVKNARAMPRRFFANLKSIPESLADRVKSERVCWSRISVKPLNDKRRVYDFIVPDTKVFAVNNGLIVYDTCSWIPIFSKDANAESEEYIHKASNYILPSGEPLADMFDDLVKLSFYAMTRDVPELKK